MRRFVCVCFLLVALVALIACDATRAYAARVNGVEITQGELEEELDAILGNEAYLASVEQQGTQVRGTGRGTFDSLFVARVLTRQLFLEIVHAEVVRRKAVPDAAELNEARAQVMQDLGGEEIFNAFPESYRETLVARTAEVTALQLELSDVDVSDAAVEAFYNENGPALYGETCVSHILFSVIGADGRPDAEATTAQAPALKTEADRVRAQIAGGSDFAALARQHSKDTGSQEQGGDLQCDTRGRFVPEFEQAMDALAVGEVSQPVQSQFGFHIIKVTDRRVKPLPEVADEIRQRLLSQAQGDFTNFLIEAVGAAKISVNPRYGRFDKNAESPGVVPPNAPPTTMAGGTPTSLVP